MKKRTIFPILGLSLLHATMPVQAIEPTRSPLDLEKLEAKVAAVSRDVLPATVALLSDRTGASGSGVIVAEDGLVLTAAHVQPRPSVSRDDRVTVRVVQGTVTIETTGRALSDARIGELIKVSSTTSIEPYTARVVADGVVLVGTR